MTGWDKALIAAVLVSALLSFYAVPRALQAGVPGRVVITVDRRVWRRLAINEPKTIKIPGRSGWCRLKISAGAAAVEASNCPERLCYYQGKIAKPGQAIVCLPHRVVVSIESERPLAGQVDAVIK